MTLEIYFQILLYKQYLAINLAADLHVGVETVLLTKSAAAPQKVAKQPRPR